MKGTGYVATETIRGDLTAEKLASAKERVVNRLCDGIKLIASDKDIFTITKFDDGHAEVTARVEINY